LEEDTVAYTSGGDWRVCVCVCVCVFVHAHTCMHACFIRSHIAQFGLKVTI